jgi:Asp/Glu/hydantoin racemase
VTAAIHIAARANTLRDASALVVACFSDPGVESLRPMLSVPVFGIREAAVSTALKRVSRFGVIALSEASVRRHLVAFEEMGVTDRLAGDRALGLSVADLESPETSKQRILDVANELKVTNGAETLILGCAGMPQYKQFIETETGLPVIEPCQAAVDMAVEAITLPGA